MLLQKISERGTHGPLLKLDEGPHNKGCYLSLYLEIQKDIHPKKIRNTKR